MGSSRPRPGLVFDSPRQLQGTCSHVYFVVIWCHRLKQPWGGGEVRCETFHSGKFRVSSFQPTFLCSCEWQQLSAARLSQGHSCLGFPPPSLGSAFSQTGLHLPPFSVATGSRLKPPPPYLWHTGVDTWLASSLAESCPRVTIAEPASFLPLAPQGPGRQRGLPSPTICPLASHSSFSLAHSGAPQRLYPLLPPSSRSHICNLEMFPTSLDAQTPPHSSSAGLGAPLGPSNSLFEQPPPQKSQIKKLTSSMEAS